MGKYVFSTRPKHPFIEESISQGISYVLRSRNSFNKAGRPKGIGKLVFQPSKRRYVVLCYEEECDRYFRSARG